MQGISDEQIIREAVSLVSEGMAVTMLVKGRSMLPFIEGGRDSAVLTRPGTVREGDVVLARIDGRRYVLHRVMEVSPERIVLMGDGNIRGQEICRPEDVLARADEVVGPDGRHRTRRHGVAPPVSGAACCRSGDGFWLSIKEPI